MHHGRVLLGMNLQCLFSTPPSTADGLVQAYNSLDQNPCAVAAYLEATCNMGCEYLACVHGNSTLISAAWTFEPLPTGYQYGAPDEDWRTDLCMCNTVLYSLVSACDACQGEKWSMYGPILSVYIPFYLSAIRWTRWVTNCSKVLPPSTWVSRCST